MRGEEVVMTIEHREILGATPRIGWLVVLLLVGAVAVLGVVVATAALFVLGGVFAWSVAVTVAGLLIAWVALVTILLLGRRRAWRG
jgi:hypothetical protein